MGTRYSHLSDGDRLYIEVLHRHGASQAGISRHLGRSRSTISREFKRATSFGVTAYIAHFGQRFYAAARRRAGLARRKLGAELNSSLWQDVRAGLALRRSPQEIAGRLRSSCFIPGSHLRHPSYVSHETIYCAIYALPRGTLRAELVSLLTRSPEGRRPRSRSSARSTRIPEMTPLSLRPPEVAARIVPGHWEADLIKGAGGRSAIGTIVERTSRYVMLVHLQGLSAKNILDAFSKRLRALPPSLRKTMTYDQGSEMALHKVLSKRLRMDIFFCDAHSPWQRGSNENANGIIREFLPKGLDLAPFTPKNLADLEFVLNNTPRAILGYKTPHEVFSRLRLDAVAGVALQA
ncbi:IS30 family transposase [Microcoleus sp. Pol14C4]|uniref:IS30 family transposase n=1 Tax=Microcoleus sp. Pol14C4 TaxID=3055398 RepID=UPI002FD69570